MKVFFLFSYFFFSVSCIWASGGVVEVIKGAAFINDIPVKKGDEVKSLDKLRTMANSYLKLKMSDATVIQLASSSSLTINSYSSVGETRKNNLSLIKGKMRALVKRIAGDDEAINFKANQIALAVRGTEFMLNAYESGGAQTVDTLLLKGRLKVSGATFENFMLEKSQYFNSQALARKGLSAVKKLKPELVKKLLEKSSEFLPELRVENGHLDLSKFFSQKMLGIIPSDVFVKGVGAAGVAAAALSGVGSAIVAGSDKEKEVEKAKEKKFSPVPQDMQVKAKKVKTQQKKAKVKQRSRVQGVTSFRYNLRGEKWDIRDAILNRKSNIKNNLCFYYIYKKLPGGNEAERFRRERRCNEFEYDL